MRPRSAAASTCAKLDRKSTRLNSSHSQISYAVFCLKKKKDLATARLPLVVANTRQVRDVARATGQLAKTDRIDADPLALFADFFFNDTATTEIYTLSLHDALPI